MPYFIATMQTSVITHKRTGKVPRWPAVTVSCEALSDTRHWKKRIKAGHFRSAFTWSMDRLAYGAV